uniref:Interleukin n=1 Tax=Echeneis naucrates TaxID=173247 RepID=A0A665ULT6_ECHNA
MTNFMTPAKTACPAAPRAKGNQFEQTCKLCRESHKIQVWLCFLLLSILNISVCAASNTAMLQECVKMITKSIERSDAMLYSPSVHDIKENCERASLTCYVQELLMVLDEEEVTRKAACIINVNERLCVEPEGCPPCEAYALKNITGFLEGLNTLLEKMTSHGINIKLCK